MSEVYSYGKIPNLPISTSLPGSLTNSPRNVTIGDLLVRNSYSRIGPTLNRSNSAYLDRNLKTDSEKSHDKKVPSQNLGNISPYFPRENPSKLVNTQIHKRIRESISQKISENNLSSSQEEVSLHYQIQKSVSKKLDEDRECPQDGINKILDE